jgi:hypothetical protein
VNNKKYKQDFDQNFKAPNNNGGKSNIGNSELTVEMGNLSGS